MKKYPKRPWFIAGYKLSQLWTILPLCFFIMFTKNGIAASIFLLCGWIYFAARASQQDWKEACDNGYATLYCSKDYLKSQGFEEEYMKSVKRIEKGEYGV